jgi:hypothetical protein
VQQMTPKFGITKKYSEEQACRHVNELLMYKTEWQLSKIHTLLSIILGKKNKEAKQV